MIKETTGAITLIPENIPEELKAHDQWVTWRYEERDEKWTKVPYTPHTSFCASTTDPPTWRSYIDAHTALARGRCDGIGFVFSEDDPFCGIDLDDCRDPVSGEIAEWAREVVARAGDGYVERSPSGAGVHIITRGTVRGGGMRKGPIEMYSRGRYFTITGHVL